MKKKEAKYLAVFIYGLALISVAAAGAVFSLFSYASESLRPAESMGLLRAAAAPGYTDMAKLAQMILLMVLALIPVAGAAAVIVFKKACAELSAASKENTELKERNSQITEKSGARDQKVQLLTKLTGRIALEFCNLFTPVVGRAIQLKARVPADDPLRGDIDEIYGASRHAMDILQQFVVIGGGWRDNSMIAIGLGELMPKITAAAREAKPGQVEIIEDYDFKNEQIMGNMSQIAGAFNCLCQNSFEALAIVNEDDDNRIGHIWFRGYIVNRSGAKYARLCVEDDGAGIDSRITPKIFEPFFTTKRSGDGAGLGLTIVKNIVDNHGGTVGCNSASGKGSVFTIDLPLVADKGRGPENAEDSNGRGGKSAEDSHGRGGKSNIVEIGKKAGQNGPINIKSSRGAKMHQKTSNPNPEHIKNGGAGICPQNDPYGNNGTRGGLNEDAERHTGGGARFGDSGLHGLNQRGDLSRRGIYTLNGRQAPRPDAFMPANRAAYEKHVASQRAARSEYRLKVLRGGADDGAAQKDAERPEESNQKAQPAEADMHNAASQGGDPVQEYQSARAAGLARGLYALKGGKDSGRGGANAATGPFTRESVESLKWSPVAADMRYSRAGGSRRAADAQSVVVIDGRQSVLNTIKDKLALSGYIVRTFENPFDALEAMEKEPCNILIASNKMKNIGGATLAGLVKATGDAAHVLLMLENTEAGATGLLRKESIDGFLMKPVSSNELLDRLSAITENHER